MMSKETVKVGMAELKVASAPVSLITTGLGSCVGICLWDYSTKIGGLAHIMLPDSTKSKTVVNMAKYADTGLRLLIEEMLKMGANKNKLVAKIAGGAQMFNFPGSSNMMKIGDRNSEAVIRCLEEEKIKLLVQDVGGNFGRTIEFFTADGTLYIRTINKGEKTI